ncbi:BURP domain-containing protein 3-like isoform X1 [Neltuma alba]|uniref:BURP domain-containing protein 3-like isoform X1 n=1 Tax=Neltuma alba TaxID=207710 RepID=UPI0010A493B4|nr:BURP domain-containing protein 3-like isoform X1 [Prosopis alba]
MKVSLLPLVAFLTIAHAANLPPPELYWKSRLPTTAMPTSITDLLHSAGGGTPVHTKYDYGDDSAASFLKYGGGVFIIYDEPETQLQHNPFASLLFLEKDLKPGHTKNLIFTKTSNQASFLPRRVVKSIPFSSTKVDEILRTFSAKPGSTEAEMMKNTIKACEESGIKGEEKYCALSLESMVDFITSKLGRHVEALSTELIMKKEAKKKEYRIMHRVKKVEEANLVVCHKLSYVYAVFYCHKMETTGAYTVPLQGEDGSKVNAMAICHTDTSEWNPKHLAFQVLKVKPGSVPVCHFLAQETVLWVPRKTPN